MAVRPVRGLALCSGAGGLELGVRLALGPRYRAVAHVERDPFAAAVLVARMADQALDPAPVWDDLRTFDGRPWRGRVDLVTAGFPCQPWSTAGARRGVDDDRWLWPDIARIVADVGPRLVLLENVPGLLAGGLGPVLGDLAGLGFDAEWDCYAAADVGAPHRRQRIFILAWLADTTGCGSQGRGVSARRGTEGARTAVADWPRTHVAHAQDDRPEGRRPARAGRPSTERQGTGPTCHSYRWPPRPHDRAGWERAAGAGLPQPAVRRVADGLAHRLDRLHTTGNGVVPLVAAVALLSLARRAGLDLDRGGMTYDCEAS